MKISVILAHPDKRSFNHAIAATVVETLNRNGHQVIFHDLYEEGFDPVLPVNEILRNAYLPHEIQRHCQEIQEAEGIVIIHPVWWGQPPATLKGWVDRIIRPGVAYEFIGEDKGEGVPIGLLQIKTAIVFNTSNTEAEREQDVFGDPLETIWKNCIFGLCGVKNFYRKTFSIIVVSSEDKRRDWLEEVMKTVDRYFAKET